MTEPLAPLSDEDLSAALDGMAGPDVEARLQADPSAQERLDALRSASQAVGRAAAAPVRGTFDALIARAIEVGTAPADTPPSPAAPTSPDGVVTPLAPRRRTSPGLQRWLVAAVIVALVAVGLGLVYSGTHDGNTQTTATGAQADRNTARGEDDATSSASEGTDAAGESSGDGGSDEVPSHDSAEPPLGAIPDADPTAQQPADLAQLGSFDDVSALRTILRAGFPADASNVEGERPTNASVDRCSAFAQTVHGDYSLAPDPDEVGYATIDGDPYLVYEFPVTDPSAEASKLITAAEPQSCDLLFTFVR